jgi:hypothetical protein
MDAFPPFPESFEETAAEFQRATAEIPIDRLIARNRERRVRAGKARPWAFEFPWSRTDGVFLDRKTKKGLR